MMELNNVKILFYSGYWDGPLNGLCEYENKIYRFDVSEMEEWIETEEEWSSRIYKLIDIEPWQLSYELYWHSLFCTNIAAYKEFDKKLVDSRFEIKNKDFYKKQKNEYKKIDYSNNTIIGTFKNIKYEN